MAVHTIHIFDRKGRTLFTKRYYPFNNNNHVEQDMEQLSEQRKLVFGMIYSLREITKILAPPILPTSNVTDTGLHSVTIGASTLHTYETNSGLRLCLYITNHPHSDHTNTSTTSSTNTSNIDPNTGSIIDNNKSTTTSISQQNLPSTRMVRQVLYYIYHELYIHCVIRSPIYTPTQPNVHDTNFETKLDAYLKQQIWF